VTAWNEGSGPPVGLVRAERERWLGGVCAGLAQVSRVSLAWIRAGFVLTALLGGLGIALYLACWLIIPEAGDETKPPGPSGAVVVAQACAGCVGLAILALLGAVAAVFGFGWLVVGLGAAVLIAVLAGWRRLGPAWALLPVAALTLPAIAVAASGLRLAPQVAASVVTPASAQAIRGHVYRSGLNTMLVDLRRTTFPAAGATVTLRIAAGMRRTIVALPADRCVRVAVRYHVNPFAARLTALFTGRTDPLFSDLVLFGRLFSRSPETTAAAATLPGPLLYIDFSSQGGSLYVRDYPSDIDPDGQPDWPGFLVHVEPRPDTRGVPRKAARALVSHWEVRRAAELRNARQVDAQMPGLCDPTAAPARHAPVAPAHRAALPRRRRR
jgi:phage shock protein PspC (stress-responsive transcriptional regulator)